MESYFCLGSWRGHSGKMWEKTNYQVRKIHGSCLVSRECLQRNAALYFPQSCSRTEACRWVTTLICFNRHCPSLFCPSSVAHVFGICKIVFFSLHTVVYSTARLIPENPQQLQLYESHLRMNRAGPKITHTEKTRVQIKKSALTAQQEVEVMMMMTTKNVLWLKKNIKLV